MNRVSDYMSQPYFMKAAFLIALCCLAVTGVAFASIVWAGLTTQCVAVYGSEDLGKALAVVSFGLYSSILLTAAFAYAKSRKGIKAYIELKNACVRNYPNPLIIERPFSITFFQGIYIVNMCIFFFVTLAIPLASCLIASDEIRKCGLI